MKVARSARPHSLAISFATEHDSAGNAPVWIFSRTVDLSAFLGSAIVSALLLAYGWWQGLLTQDAPEWTWVTGVLLVDVAHVYATAFRVYFIPAELRRRPWLFLLTPALAFLLGWAVASESEPVFWRCLAYLAVFHFVRQQVGWVAWYRRRAKDSPHSAWLDYAAIYLATIYPLVYWHAHLPRQFWWFVSDDFFQVPAALAQILFPLYAAVMTVYAVRAAIQWLRGNFRDLGKDIVVGTTAACWYLGIVALNSDYAFTVTNVLIHGIPYLCLTFWYSRAAGEPRWLSGSLFRAGVLFVATVWLLAYVEELFWNRAIWQEHLTWFGPAIDIGAYRPALVAVLAVPQVTHYVLDGFLWRRGEMSREI